MLTGTGFGDDSLLTHTTGEKCLPDTMVNLMGSGMRRAFILEVNLSTLKRLAEILAMIEWRRSTDVGSVKVRELLPKRFVVDGVVKTFFKLKQGRHEHLWHIATTIGSVMPVLID